MEISYTVPEPWVLWGIAAWFVSGILGLIIMIVADFRAKKLWGAEPYIRPDWILGGPLTLILGLCSLIIVLRP